MALRTIEYTELVWEMIQFGYSILLDWTVGGNIQFQILLKAKLWQLLVVHVTCITDNLQVPIIKIIKILGVSKVVKIPMDQQESNQNK